MRYILVASMMVLLGMAGFAAEEKSEHKAGDIMSVDIGGGVKMEFVWCPPGEFMMGSEKGKEDEKPVHRVRFAQGFWIGKCEVTKSQWKMIMGTEPWKEAERLQQLMQGNLPDGPDFPVMDVSWDEAQAYCRKIGSGFRLPSEAEWEYACRAGRTTEYCFGNSETRLADYAWYGADPDESTEAYAHRVGRKKPNDWGLYDIHGNLWEWCQDWFHDSYQGAPSDGGAWELPAAEKRIVRGGSWYYPPPLCRAAHRWAFAPSRSLSDYGFRLVRTP